MDRFRSAGGASGPKIGGREDAPKVNRREARQINRSEEQNGSDQAAQSGFRRLHDEGQILQLFLHAIEIAAHAFKTHDGVARVLRAYTVSASGEKALSLIHI